MEDCLFVASRCDPHLFSDRGLITLETLSTREARDFEFRRSSPIVLVTYAETTADEAPFLFIIRRTRQRGADWKMFYDFAVRMPRRDVDSIIAAWERERPALRRR